MTREEEERRLALSTAVAKINAAIDSLRRVTWSSPVCEEIAGRVGGEMRGLARLAQIELDELRAKRAAEDR